jgi:photosystem II stability/assembly factor-like uncharacterized protein
MGGLMLGCMIALAVHSSAVAAPPVQPSPPGGLGLNRICAPNGIADLLDRPALQVRRPEKCVLLDVTTAGPRLVAVGERGIVILSDDNGTTWRQARVPTSVSLTSVDFPSPTKGWAVGHSGVVLHSKDGGQTWERQLDGILAARLAYQVAQMENKRLGPDNEAARQQLAAAQLLVKDGAEKPFLDVAFTNEEVGIIVGAYGLIFHTMDGGKTWASWINRIDNPKGFHFYNLQVDRNLIYLAGEQGLFCFSDDGGQSFRRITTPYRGSFFTSTLSKSGKLLIAGLRGNAYWFDELTETFTQIVVSDPVSLSTAVMGPDGLMLFANQAGQILSYREQNNEIDAVETPRVAQVAAMALSNDGTLITAGVRGIIGFRLPTDNPGSKTGGAQ